MLTAPSVYVEEVTSGGRTIVGVATAITAFLGRAAKGYTDADPEAPVIVNSFSEFEQRFGRLDAAYPMAYAVRNFYLNGSGQAAIVRLYKAGESPSHATIDLPNLSLVAASPGAWGNKLRVRLDSSVSAEAAAGDGLDVADLFNLSVCDMQSGEEEIYFDLTVKESPRRVDRVLQASSSLVRVASTMVLPATIAPPAHAPPPAGKSAWEDDASSTGVASAAEAADSAALDDAAYTGDEAAGSGLWALGKLDLFNLVCIPADVRGASTSPAVYQAALALCVDKRALLIVDPPADWTTVDTIIRDDHAALAALGVDGAAARNAVLFYPRVLQSDPALDGQIDTFVPCGIVAGVMARTDAQRGVWKAPAGSEAALNCVQGLSVILTDEENGSLNAIGVNCLRSFATTGPVVWGSRTMRGADAYADEYKYVPVRRLALHIEESLSRGTQWVATEPNDEPLWAQIRLSVGAFMNDLFRQGAFQGTTSRDAYFVKCDSDTTTQADIDLGFVNILVGFAPMRPAEFVVIRLQQMAGRIDA